MMGACKSKEEKYEELKKQVDVESISTEWNHIVDSLNAEVSKPENLARIDSMYRLRNILFGNIKIYEKRRHKDNYYAFSAPNGQEGTVKMLTKIDEPMDHRWGQYMNIDTTNTAVKKDKLIMHDINRYVKNEEKINATKQKNVFDSVNHKYSTLHIEKIKLLSDCYNELYK
ncbi:MAG: hypothetical protein LBF37_01170 [Rickettsiales bacterium]|nr:hypothetical protein [Rickettsiales bacterium]